MKAGSFIYIHLYVEKNKTRLHPDMAYEEWKAELDILKEHLDMGNPQDYIAYRNVELELLCKTRIVPNWKKMCVTR